MTNSSKGQFRYTHAQWQAVARHLPNGVNHKKIRDYLESAADAYLDLKLQRAKEDNSRASTGKLDHVVRLAEKLKDTIKDVQVPLSSLWVLEIEQIIAWAEYAKRKDMALRRSRNDYRKILMAQVLASWQVAGGELSFSKHQRKNRKGQNITGPLPRFVCAAIKPIMGQDAFGAERIAELIKKFKYWAPMRDW